MLASSFSSSSEMKPGFSLNELNPQAPMTTVEAIPPSVHADWHSPVPYLFGGLAAMLGLITFALLILACSYWKLSGYVERVESGEHASGTANSGDNGRAADETLKEKPTAVLEERFVVIMAGDEKKIFLANPIRSRASSLTGGGGEEESSGGGDETRDHV